MCLRCHGNNGNTSVAFMFMLHILLFPPLSIKQTSHSSFKNKQTKKKQSSHFLFSFIDVSCEMKIIVGGALEQAFLAQKLFVEHKHGEQLFQRGTRLHICHHNASVRTVPSCLASRVPLSVSCLYGK